MRHLRVLALVLCFAADAAAQMPQFLVASAGRRGTVAVDARAVPVLRRRISVAFEGVRLEEALRVIAAKGGLQLNYSRDIVPTESRVRLSADDITVAAALTEVLFDAGVDVLIGAGQEVTVDLALEPKPTLLEDVVVTGTVIPTEVKALPTPVSVISAEDIERQRPRHVQQVLRQVVPTAVAWDLPSAPVQTALSVRGATTLSGGLGQMKLYVDGIEVANFTYAGVDPNSIDRIEVIRGPQAAAIYGSDAIGGVIQVFTKRGDPTLRRAQVEAQAALGVMQTPYVGFDAVLRQEYAAALRGGGTDATYSVGGGYSRLGDYLPDGEISRQSNPSVYGGARIARGIVTFDVSGRHYVQNNPQVSTPAVLETGFVPVSRPTFQPTQNQHQTLGTRIGIVPRGGWQVLATFGTDRRTTDLTQVRPRLTTPADTLLSVFNAVQSKLSVGANTAIKGTLATGLWGQVTAGFDHYSLLVTNLSGRGPSTVGTLANPSASRTVTNNTGYFVQGQLGILDALFLTGGLRAENNSNFGDSLGTPLSPRVGASYVHRLGATTLKARGSWGRAIRAPSPGLKSEVVRATLITLANPTLGPERQHGWDAGLDVVFGSGGSLGVTYYDQRTRDLITAVVLALQPVITNQWQNVGRVHNSGLEVEGLLDLGSTRLRGQYGYTRARVRELSPGYRGDLVVGDQTHVTPNHMAGASLTVTPASRMTLTAGLTYVGTWRAPDFVALFRCRAGTGPCAPSFIASGSTPDFVVSYPGFVKLNLTVTHDVTPRLTGFVSADNLTNNQKTEFFNTSPAVGRITTAGLRFRF